MSRSVLVSMYMLCTYITNKKNPEIVVTDFLSKVAWQKLHVVLYITVECHLSGLQMDKYIIVFRWLARWEEQVAVCT